MRRLAIIHFSPIELYPPALNFIHFLAGRLPGDWQVRVFTMHPPAGYPPFMSPSPRIRILRYGSAATKQGIGRYGAYAAFYWRTLLALGTWRPDTLFYYETLSALPALFYKRRLRRRARLFIHYHEYTSPQEYQQGMRLAAWQHRMERKRYRVAEWVSHTNEDRNRFFLADLGGIAVPGLGTLPNYPPASWLGGSRLAEGRGGAASQPGEAAGQPLKIVYVGALSLDTMYTREFAEWVTHQQGAVTWDVFTSNADGAALDYLRSCDPALIRLHPAVNYYQLPETLAGYDVGIILYNGHIPNYVYNAPNKLFEYWACGLDVWVPDKLTTSLRFVNEGVFPRIIGLDFAALSGFDWRRAASHGGLKAQPSVYSSERAFDVLWKKMREELPPTS